MHLDNHEKTVKEIRVAVAEHKKTQIIVDLFFVGIFLIFLLYAGML